MLQHDYTNHAFCSSSELHLSSPPRVQRTNSTRSLKQKKSPQHNTRSSVNSTVLSIKKTEQLSTQKLSQFRKNQQLFQTTRQIHENQKSINTNFERSNHKRYALVPIEELRCGSNYAIAPDLTLTSKRYNNLVGVHRPQMNKYANSNEDPPQSFEEAMETTKMDEHNISSYPLIYDELSREEEENDQINEISYKRADRTYSREGHTNKLLLVADDDDDGELVDDYSDTNNIYNRSAHRYAIIPNDIDNDHEHELKPNLNRLHNTSRMNRSQEILDNFEFHDSNPEQNNFKTQSSISSRNSRVVNVFPKLSSQNKSLTAENITYNRKHLQTPDKNYQINRRSPSNTKKYNNEISLQTQPILESPKKPDRNTAVISPLVDVSNIYPQISKPTNDNRHSEVTLTIVPLMLTLGSTMNSCLIIYLIAHLGKLFYLQYSLVAAFSGVGLGALGFRARHCMWVPNRGYISGFILVTIICLLKCCGLLVILVYDPYPGLPLHDVTTGIILSLSTFIMFFIGLGIIGSLWCYRPPPDNRINVI